MNLPRILVGDIGGTKTTLALYAGDSRPAVAKRTFTSAKHSGLSEMLRTFLSEAGASVDAAAFGIAGPVENDLCRTTNLPWDVDGTEISATLGIRSVRLMNDFEATARGILELAPEDLVVLQEGRSRPDGHVAVLGAGTGLGEALLVPGPAGPTVLATEGGHTDFAPRNALEDDLLRFLRARHPSHVSVERVVSGPGLFSIFEFLVESRRFALTPLVKARIENEDPSAVVGELGVSAGDAGCRAALEIFVSLYGAEAGNLALKSLPTGGLFIAGGIAPKILPMLASGAFLDSYLDKGRMRGPLERIRVSIVVNAEVGLEGARAVALRNCRPAA